MRRNPDDAEGLPGAAGGRRYLYVSKACIGCALLSGRLSVEAQSRPTTHRSVVPDARLTAWPVPVVASPLHMLCGAAMVAVVGRNISTTYAEWLRHGSCQRRTIFKKIHPCHTGKERDLCFAHLLFWHCRPAQSHQRLQQERIATFARTRRTRESS